MRFNGHIVGVRNIPTSSGATGVFNLTEHELYVLGTAWPQQWTTSPIYTLDPYFNWNTGLLIGTGTSSNTNLTVTDSSTNAFTISRTGSPRQTSFNPFGISDGSIFCNGSSYQTFPASSNWDFGSGSFTIEMWINPTLSASETTFVEHGWAGSGALNYGFRVGTNSSYQLIMYANGTTYAFTDLIISSATWTHVAWVGVGGVLYAYKNGIKSTVTGSYSSIVDRASATLIVGGFNSNNENIAERYFYTGYISNLRIVKGSALYTNSFSPPLTSLTAVSGTVLLTAQVTSATSNNAFYDLSTNHATATVVNNVQLPFSPLGSLSTSGSQYMNGSTSYLSTPINTSFSFAGNFTIEGWFCLDYLPAYTQILGNYTGNNSTDWIIEVTSAGAIQAYTNGSTPRITYSGANIKTYTWYHFALVRSGTTITLYVNGISGGTYTQSGTFGSDAKIVNIGANGAGTYPVYGYISNIRFVNGSAVYTGTFKPPIKPFDHTDATALAACYADTTNVATDSSVITNTKLLLKTADANFTANTTLNNNTFIDSSVYAFPVTASGTPVQGTFSPFAQDGRSWSIEFNGSNSYISTTATASNYTLSSGDWTIEYWAYHKTLKDVNSLLTLGSGGSELYYALTSGTASGAILFGSGAGSWGWSQQYTGTTGAITTNKWQHIAIVRYNGNLYFYVDGVNKGISNSFNFGSGGQGGLYIGTYFANYNNDGSYWDGILSNLRIVRGTALYTANNFTVPTSPLTLTPTANTTLLTANSNRFRDASNNNVTFSITGTPKVVSHTPFNSTVAYANTVNGGSVYLNGSDYLIIGDSDALDVGTGDFTLECWVYISSLASTFQSFVTKGGIASIDVAGYSIGMYNSNIYATIKGGSTASSAGAYPAKAGEWYHLVLTRNSGTCKFFVNGIQNGLTPTNTDDLSTSRNFHIGADYSGSNRTTGFISNVRLIKGVALYTSNISSPIYVSTISTGPLQQKTSLALDFTNAAIYDSSMMGNYITVGNTKLSSVAGNPQGAGYAMYFDGTGDWLNVTQNGREHAFGTSDFTVEVWLYASGSGIKGIYDNDYSSSGGFAIGINQSSNLVYVAPQASGSGFGYCQFNATIPSSTWTHLAVVATSGIYKCFINGVACTLSSGSTTVLNVTRSTGQVRIGDLIGQSGSYTYAGYMYGLRISKGARYTSNFTTALPYGIGLFGAAPSNTNRAIFTGSGTWTVPTGITSVNALIVGGGGGGTDANAGGGGAGGLLNPTAIPVTPGQTYTIIVGAGGGRGISGSNTSVFGYTSTGGGAGGYYAGFGGGSGGGAGGQNSNYSGGTAVSGQGYAGGSSASGAGGGGGGAGGAGSNATGPGGAGGSGVLSTYSGASVYYAAGGGGGGNNSGSAGAVGGNGGGGTGGTGLNNGTNATPNSGSGGGGGAGVSGVANSNGGSGGSGIVIITW